MSQPKSPFGSKGVPELLSFRLMNGWSIHLFIKSLLWYYNSSTSLSRGIWNVFHRNWQDVRERRFRYAPDGTMHKWLNRFRLNQIYTTQYVPCWNHQKNSWTNGYSTAMDSIKRFDSLLISIGMGPSHNGDSLFSICVHTRAFLKSLCITRGLFEQLQCFVRKQYFMMYTNVSGTRELLEHLN